MSEIVCQALLTADKVIIEQGNQKKSLIGVFSNFIANEVPAIFPPWFIYGAVTNIEGKHSFSLNLIHSESGHVLLSRGGEIESKDPRKVVEIVIQVVNVQFHQFGVYTLQLNFDGKEILSRNIRVQNNKEEKHE
jgi:hypothetical protein